MQNKFDIQGHLSTAFIEMLEEGKLTGIGLETNRREHLAIADGTYVIPRKQELQLTPTAGKWSEHPIQRFREAMNLGAQNGYENARITFTGQDQKSHSVKLNTQTGNVLGDGFIKKRRLSGFTALLSEADVSINQEIKLKMIQALR